MPKISDKTKEDIVKWLQEGNSQHSAIKKFGASAHIVSDLAKKNNIKPPEAKAAQTKNAIARRQFYTKENRIKAWDSIFEMCMVRFKDEDLSAFAFQKLVLALAAATDKLRQEEAGSDDGKAEILAIFDKIKNST